MEKKLIKISDMRQSPIRQAILPDGFIERVRAFKQALADVENSSLEEAVSNFQRDLHPERELIIWEHITEAYQKFISGNEIKDFAARREVFSVALATSTGITNFSNIKLLNKKQIENIVSLYRE